MLLLPLASIREVSAVAAPFICLIHWPTGGSWIALP
jgi:hypothetical protein